MADALMFSLFAFLFVGPLFFAIVGGLILHKVHKIAIARSIALLISPFLLFAGGFASSLKHKFGWGFSNFGVDPELNRLAIVIAGLTLFWLVVLFVLLVPFCHKAFEKEDRSLRKTLKAAGAVAGVAYFILILAFLPASNFTILKPDLSEDWTDVIPPENLTVYFIDESKVWKSDLTSGKFEPIKDLDFDDGDLFFVRETENSGQVIASNPRGRDVAVEKAEFSDKMISTDRGEQASLMAYKPSGELFVPPMLLLASPLIRWHNGRDNMFPSGEVLFDLGGRIYFYNPKNSKIYFVRRGRSPLLIIRN